MRKILVALFMIFIFTGIISATLEGAAFGFAKDMSMSYVSSQNPALGQAINFVMCPQCAITSSALGALDSVVPGASQAYGFIQNPEGAALALAKQNALKELTKDLSPKEQMALNNIQKFQPYIKEAFEVNPDAPKEQQKGTIEIDEDGNTIIKNSNGETFAKIPPGFEAVESKEGFVLKNKEGDIDAVLEIKNYKISLDKDTTITFSEEDGISTINLEGQGDFISEKTILEGIEDATIRLNENEEVTFAKFTSVRVGFYEFNYDNQKFIFNTNTGSKVLFDPEKGKISGENTLLKYKDLKIRGDDFEGLLDEEGNFKEIKITNGFYQDKINNLEYSSAKDFSLYLYEKDISNKGHAISVFDGRIKSKGLVKIENGFIYEGLTDSTIFEKRLKGNYELIFIDGSEDKTIEEGGIARFVKKVKVGKEEVEIQTVISKINGDLNLGLKENSLDLLLEIEKDPTRLASIEKDVLIKIGDGEAYFGINTELEMRYESIKGDGNILNSKYSQLFFGGDININPNDVKLKNFLEKNSKLVVEKDYDTFRKRLGDFIGKSEGDTTNAKIILAQTFIQEGNHEFGIQFIEKIVDENPDNKNLDKYRKLLAQYEIEKRKIPLKEALVRAKLEIAKNCRDCISSDTESDKEIFQKVQEIMSAGNPVKLIKEDLGLYNKPEKLKKYKSILMGTELLSQEIEKGYSYAEALENIKEGDYLLEVFGEDIASGGYGDFINRDDVYNALSSNPDINMQIMLEETRVNNNLLLLEKAKAYRKLGLHQEAVKILKPINDKAKDIVGGKEVFMKRADIFEIEAIELIEEIKRGKGIIGFSDNAKEIFSSIVNLETAGEFVNPINLAVYGTTIKVGGKLLSLSDTGQQLLKATSLAKGSLGNSAGARVITELGWEGIETGAGFVHPSLEVVAMALDGGPDADFYATKALKNTKFKESGKFFVSDGEVSQVLITSESRLVQIEKIKGAQRIEGGFKVTDAEGRTFRIYDDKKIDLSDKNLVDVQTAKLDLSKLTKKAEDQTEIIESQKILEQNYPTIVSESEIFNPSKEFFYSLGKKVNTQPKEVVIVPPQKIGSEYIITTQEGHFIVNNLGDANKINKEISEKRANLEDLFKSNNLRKPNMNDLEKIVDSSPHSYSAEKIIIHGEGTPWELKLKEIKKVQQAEQKLKSIIAEKIGVDESRVISVGSTARGTFLPSTRNPDLDFSVIIDPEINPSLVKDPIKYQEFVDWTKKWDKLSSKSSNEKTKMLNEFLEPFEDVLEDPGKLIPSHPMILGKIDGIESEISLVYKPDDANSIYYSKLEHSKATPQEMADIRKLKYFLKNIDTYKGTGFSGSMSEQLILQTRTYDKNGNIVSQGNFDKIISKILEHGGKEGNIILHGTKNIPSGSNGYSNSIEISKGLSKFEGSMDILDTSRGADFFEKVDSKEWEITVIKARELKKGTPIEKIDFTFEDWQDYASNVIRSPPPGKIKSLKEPFEISQADLSRQNSEIVHTKIPPPKGEIQISQYENLGQKVAKQMGTIEGIESKITGIETKLVNNELFFSFGITRETNPNIITRMGPSPKKIKDSKSFEKAVENFVKKNSNQNIQYKSDGTPFFTKPNSNANVDNTELFLELLQKEIQKASK